jgi:hypothetical protein
MQIKSVLSAHFAALVFSVGTSAGSAIAAENNDPINCGLQKRAPTKASSTTVKTNSPKELLVIQSIEGCTSGSTSSDVRHADLLEKTTKLALDAATESTRSSSEYASKSLESIKTLLTWLGGFFTFLVAMAAVFGWKTVNDLKKDILSIARKQISRARLSFRQQTDQKVEEFERLKVDFAR